MPRNRINIPKPAPDHVPMHYPLKELRPKLEDAVQVFYRELQVFECIHCFALVVDHGTLHNCPDRMQEVDIAKVYVDTILQRRLIELITKRGFTTKVVGYTCEN